MNRAPVCGSWTLVTALLVAAHLVSAQGQPPQIVPVEREPQHRHVFENAVLAVLDVRFPPGYVSLFHTHSNDNVSVRIATGPTRTDTLQAAGTPQTALVGRVVFNSAAPPYTHRVANLGDTTIRILDVEILAKAPTVLASTVDQLAGHDLVVENDRVRIHRVVVQPGATLASHVHPRGRLEATVRGPVPGAFVWRDSGGGSAAIVAGPEGTEVVEIEVK